MTRAASTTRLRAVVGILEIGQARTGIGYPDSRICTDSAGFAVGRKHLAVSVSVVCCYFRSSRGRHLRVRRSHGEDEEGMEMAMVAKKVRVVLHNLDFSSASQIWRGAPAG
jgi:hypothetical protein